MMRINFRTFCALFGAFAGLVLSARAQTEITLDRAVYLPGEPITVSFRNGPGNIKDWIGVYVDGAPPDTYVDWQYLDGTQVGNLSVTDGSVTFAAGVNTVGPYLVRLLVNDGYTTAATANFTVAVVPRVRTDKPKYKPGEPIVVQFLNGPGNAKDWIGLYDAVPPITVYRDFLYVDGTPDGNTGRTEGTLSFPGGLNDSGDYEALFFENDSFTVLDRTLFSVVTVGPAVTLIPGDQQVRLQWEAVTQPAPVAKYRILAAPGPDEVFHMVTEVTGLEFLHTSLPNDVEVCYLIRAVSATGTEGPDSTLQCTAPYALAAGHFISYQVPPGTIGNYSFQGVLGMDFEVVNPISVHQLGIFDDGANGLKRTLKVTLYERTAMQEKATVSFDTFDPGVFKGGSRFKPLLAPVELPFGFKGTIVAEGFGPDEKAGNSAIKDLSLQLGSGNASVFFSASRFGNAAGTFPGTIEPGVPNLYAAGTFEFSTTPPVAPGKPIVTSIPDDGSVTLFWQTIQAPLPAATYEILKSATPEGPFDVIGEVADTAYTDTGLVNGTPLYYVVRGVATGGMRGVQSEVVAVTPDLPAAGVAYVVPASTHGNQTFSGSAGNDFEVIRPLEITRLGVFDDGSDGLNRSIKCRLYDRASKTELAFLQFTPADPGELIDGSRFKDLASPLYLPIGFKGAIVASGYGEGEKDGNQGVGPISLQLYAGASVRFVGRSRWGENPDAFPEIIDGGPVNRYAAGTFYFRPVDESGHLTIRSANGRVTLEWRGVGVLQSAPTPSGPWDLVIGAVSGMQFTPSANATFYRVRLVP